MMRGWVAMLAAGAVAAAIGGCANAEAERAPTGSLGGPAVKKPVQTAKASAAPDPVVAAKVKWCRNRYVEHANGQRPGGAQDTSEKVMHDIECAAVGVGGSWKAENATKGL